MKRFKPLTFGWLDRSVGDYRLILLGLMLTGYLIVQIPRESVAQPDTWPQDAVSISVPDSAPEHMKE